MRKIVIADTSCLILLYKINELDLLKRLYDQVLITPDVAEEFMQQVPEWIEIDESFDRKYQSMLEMEVDRGEASSIALAMKIEESILVLDDFKARKVAEKLGLKYTGTFGLIAKSKLEGVIPSVIPIIGKIKSTNFRVSDKIIEETLREAGE